MKKIKMYIMLIVKNNSGLACNELNRRVFWATF